MTSTEWLLAVVGGLAVVAVLVAVVALVRLRRVVAAPGRVPTELMEAFGRLSGLVEGRLDPLWEGQETIRRAIEALYTKAGHRGRWGELSLRRFLEAAGLTPKVDFDEQVFLGGDEQGDLEGAARPDVVVHLGQAGEAVIDAKTPLEALQKAWESDSEDARLAALREHAQAVKKYASALKKRGYAARLKAAFVPVVMFMPMDGAWEAAEEVNANLVEEVLRMGIYPASPRSIGLVVELLRHQAQTLDQDRTARAIVEQGRTLVDRIGVHVNHLVKAGNCLNGAVEAFNAAVGSLEARVLPTARKVAAMVPEGRPPAEVAIIERRPQVGRLEGLMPDEGA